RIPGRGSLPAPLQGDGEGSSGADDRLLRGASAPAGAAREMIETAGARPDGARRRPGTTTQETTMRTPTWPSRPRELLTLLVFALSVPAADLSAQGRAFEPSDWYRLTTLSSPSMSPDGAHVAFTFMTVLEEENRRHREVWLVPTAGGDPVRLTAPGTESSDPRWSHD